MRDPKSRGGRVEEPELPPNLFVVGLLHDLKVGNYSRKAWGAFWRNSWVRSVQIIHEHERLRSSWISFGIAGAGGIALAGLLALGFVSPAETLAFLLTSLFWWGILMADLGLHLGLMVNLHTGELERSIGLANALTELRGFAAIWVIWGTHWASHGTYLPLLLVVGAAGASDLLDGWIARRWRASTRWGRLYDPFMDGIFFSAAAISLAVVGLLPEWLAALVTFRYAFPIAGAIIFLFARRRTPRVRHTTWGRISSASIAVMVFFAAVAYALRLPVELITPGIYAAVTVAAVGALLTILVNGIEQA